MRTEWGKIFKVDHKFSKKCWILTTLWTWRETSNKIRYKKLSNSFNFLERRLLFTIFRIYNEIDGTQWYNENEMKFLMDWIPYISIHPSEGTIYIYTYNSTFLLCTNVLSNRLFRKELYCFWYHNWIENLISLSPAIHINLNSLKAIWFVFGGIGLLFW